MATYTVTFTPDVGDPVSFVIEDYAVAAAQQFVDAFPADYSSVPDLARKMLNQHVFGPLCERYNSYPSELASIITFYEAAKTAKEDGVASANDAAMAAPPEP